MISGEWRRYGEGIGGWVKSDKFSHPLWIELCAEGETLGIARADLPEPHNCGFWLPLSPAIIENSERFEVRIVNSDEILPEIQYQETEAENNENETLIGSLSVDRGLTLVGWVIDPSRSEIKLELTAYVDGAPAASAVAGARQYRPIQADGHAFSITLPEIFADGKSHVVELRDSEGRLVPGCPIRILLQRENVAQWLRELKKPEKPLLDAIADIFENMEMRLPGLAEHASFASWKKAFPIHAPEKRHRASIKILGAKNNLLAGQQGGEFKAAAQNGEYVLLANDGDQLHKFAVAHMIDQLRHHDADAIYADGETNNGEPLFKPAWDREAFIARDYLGPMLVKASLLKNLDVCPNDDVATLRCKVLLQDDAVSPLHCPMPLYIGDLPPDTGVRENWINRWLQEAYPGTSKNGYDINWQFSRQPRVSIVIPTRDHGKLLKTCLDSLAITSWPNYEVIIIDNGSVEEDALAILRQAEAAAHICVLRRPGVFNYADLNNDAVKRATGEFICFLNNDAEIVHEQWLAELVNILLMAGNDAGAVGAKLLWPNNLVQHGGVVVGTHQLAAHVGNQWLADEAGYMDRNLFCQRYSAVTAACMLTPRDLFLSAGGFDGRRFPVAFNDVDYCLRLGQMGKKIYWTPRAVLNHHESASRGKDAQGSAKARSEREIRMFRRQWGHFDDPFYNPNLPLSAVSEPFLGLAFPPRPRLTR